MKRKYMVVHLLSLILVLSTIYHSTSHFSILAIFPFAVVSYSVQSEYERYMIPMLSLATFISLFFVTLGSMNEIFLLLIFSLTFSLPLLLYWIIVLLEEVKVQWKPLGVSLSYVLLTVLTFYLLPELIDISGFLLSPENRGVQTLMFFGSGMIMAVAFHVTLEVKGRS